MSQSQIFIVDDDEGHALLVENSLRDAGVSNEIVQFRNGDDVLDYVFADEAQVPLLMLLDLNMPGIRGTEVLARLRADERTSAVPVIIVTTTSQAPEIEECYKLGCNLYVTKPVQYSEFVNAIRTLGLVFEIVKLPGEERVAIG